jgi:predicted alpha/beta-hydrolase family hydrolase
VTACGWGEPVTKKATEAENLFLAVDGGAGVSALLQVPRGAEALLVLAHGAGAGMNHPFMAALASGLAERAIATLRYQFPYMERGSKRPDTPQLAHATVRAAVAAAAQAQPELPRFAGGKSFGGRMSSQTQAKTPLNSVRGLVFVGFPLHPAGRPSTDRAKHLGDVAVPMLFLQGTRDALAELSLLEPVCKSLGKRATLKLFADADHSFHVPAKSGRKDADAFAELLDVTAAWIKHHAQ